MLLGRPGRRSSAESRLGTGMSGTRMLGAAIGAVSAVVGVALLVFAVASGLVGELWGAFFFQTTVFGAMFGAIGFAAARRNRLNTGVWVTTLAGALMTMV